MPALQGSMREVVLCAALGVADGSESRPYKCKR